MTSSLRLARGLALASILGTASGGANTPAQGPAQGDDAKQSIDAEIGHLSRELAELSSSERGLLGEIQRLSTLERLKALESARHLEGARAAQRDIDRSVVRLDALESGEAALKARLAERLRALYMSGRAGAPQLLLSGRRAGASALLNPGSAPGEAADPTSALRHATAIASADAALAAGARSARRAVESARGELVIRQAALEKAGREAAAAALDLSGARRKRETLLASLRSDRTAREGALAELKRASDSLAGLARDLSRGSSSNGSGLDFSRFRGLLPWPASGRVTAGFGRVVDPRFRTSVPHDGLDIAAESGSDVRAVFEGRVVFAGWLSGYGLTVMIDHGGGYMTVSAHASVLLMEKGEAVTAGRVVAKVGDTGSLSGPYLYFEIRKDGRPVNPGVWLKRR